MDKQLLEREAGESWEQTTQHFKEGVNPTAYILGYKTAATSSSTVKELERENKELRNALNILWLCLQEAPVDFLGTGSNSKAADKDEREWNKKWNDAYDKVVLNNQPPQNNL